MRGNAGPMVSVYIHASAAPSLLQFAATGRLEEWLERRHCSSVLVEAETVQSKKDELVTIPDTMLRTVGLDPSALEGTAHGTAEGAGKKDVSDKFVIVSADSS